MAYFIHRDEPKSIIYISVFIVVYSLWAWIIVMADLANSSVLLESMKNDHANHMILPSYNYSFPRYKYLFHISFRYISASYRSPRNSNSQCPGQKPQQPLTIYYHSGLVGSPLSHHLPHLLVFLYNSYAHF